MSYPGRARSARDPLFAAHKMAQTDRCVRVPLPNLFSQKPSHFPDACSSVNKCGTRWTTIGAVGTLNAQVSSQPLCDHHGKCPCRPLPVDERVPPHGYLHSARRPLCSSPQPPACVSSVLIAPKFFTLTSAAQRTYSPRPLLRPLARLFFLLTGFHRDGFKTVPVNRIFSGGFSGVP